MDLKENPERFTGYAGESSARVWRSIYEENCFTYAPELKAATTLALNAMRDTSSKAVCSEKVFFYRLVSGLHASISMHIALEDYNRTTGRWGPNVEQYERRLAPFPDRLENIYFATGLVFAAVSKAADYVARYSYCLGEEEDEAAFDANLARLMAVSAEVSGLMDTRSLFAGPDARVSD